MLLGQTSCSRLPWPPVHFPFPFLPSYCFSSSCLSGGWASGIYIYTCCERTCLIMCVMLGATSSFKSKDRHLDNLGVPCFYLLAFVFFHASCLEAPIPSGRGLSRVLDSIIIVITHMAFRSPQALEGHAYLKNHTTWPFKYKKTGEVGLGQAIYLPFGCLFTFYRVIATRRKVGKQWTDAYLVI